MFRVHFVEGDRKYFESEKDCDQAFQTYLKDRLKETRNPLLTAYYSHSLWVIPATKHAEHARTAVAAYLELLRIFEKKTIDAPEVHFGFHLIRAVGNSFSLAYQTNFRWDEIKSEIRRLVIEFDFANPASFNLRRDLIRLMLNSKRKFMGEDFEGLAEVCWQMYQNMLGWGRIEVSIEALELGEKADSRLGSKTHDWISEKAACYENLVNRYRNTPNELMHCQNALTTYKQAKKWDKVQELERKYCEIKATATVATFTEEIDLTEHVQEMQADSRRVGTMGI